MATSRAEIRALIRGMCRAEPSWAHRGSRSTVAASEGFIRRDRASRLIGNVADRRNGARDEEQLKCHPTASPGPALPLELPGSSLKRAEVDCAVRRAGSHWAIAHRTAEGHRACNRRSPLRQLIRAKILPQRQPPRHANRFLARRRPRPTISCASAAKW